MPRAHIVQEGDAVLRTKAKPICPADIASIKTRALISRMQSLLAKEESGVGLAAPQVGASVRLFIVSGRALLMQEAADTNTEEKDLELPPDLICINPAITRMSKRTKSMDEGCLSVRGLYGKVPRHEKVTLRAHDEKGKIFTRHATGLIAQIFQHEMDHLDGILYIDKAVELDETRRHGSTKEHRPLRAASTPLA